MPRKVSGGACARCRTRHLKCDEKRPECERCLVANVKCPGYFQETKFLDQGVGLRRKFKYLEHSQELVADGSSQSKLHTEAPLRTVLPYERSSNSPKQIPPGTPRQDLQQTLYRNIDANVTEQRSPSDVSIITIGGSTPDVQDQTRSGSPAVQPPFSTDESLSENVQLLFPTKSETLSASENHPQLTDDSGEDEAFEILFLMRHFVETIGPWMDHLDNYFASVVPVEASHCPLLKYAACAIAAKHLGRVRGRKRVKSRAATESFPDSEATDWPYKAAKYYDKAIISLQKALVRNISKQCLYTCGPDEDDRIKRRRIEKVTNCGRNINCSSAVDGLLSGTSILSVYEFMDGSNMEWSRHLSGVKSLLDAANISFMPQDNTGSRAQLATFWNFARCDYLAAFINRTKTRLDPSDFNLWRAAGLEIKDATEEKKLLSPTSQSPNSSGFKEDIYSHRLVWILSKMMNLLASESYDLGNCSAHWNSLEKELESWYQDVPSTFQPAIRLEPDPNSSNPARSLFAEVFHTIPSCAVTMQHYYTGQILLLLHKPRGPLHSITDQVRRHREISDKILCHSREICAIALGRPPRIHMLQPLFLAGQCLESTEERKIILDLLRRIESELGWASQYRVDELLAEWGWRSDGTP